jgi:hypothetical protein
MITKLKFISKPDSVCILILLSAVISTRLILILNTPFLYGQDAYLYLGQARDFASTGAIEFKEGMPFVFFLGGFVKVFGPLVGEIYASRFFVVLASVILVIIIYLFGLRMSGRLLGLSAALLATFEPLFLLWSTVPYREVFAYSLGLLALYFTISDRRGQTVLSLVFFYLAIFTRSELYLALVVPILILYFRKALKVRSKEGLRASFIVPLVFAMLLFVLPSVGIFLYVQSWGAFGLVPRVALFLTPELLSRTIESSFRFYDQQLLNRAIYAFVGLVLVLGVLKTFIHVSYKKEEKKFPILLQNGGVSRIKDALFSDSGITAVSLFLFSVVYIIVLTIFAYGYNWAFYVPPSDRANLDILRAAVIITSLPERYLMLLRLLICYPLAYPLVLVVRKLWGEMIHEK